MNLFIILTIGCCLIAHGGAQDRDPDVSLRSDDDHIYIHAKDIVREDLDGNTGSTWKQIEQNISDLSGSVVSVQENLDQAAAETNSSVRKLEGDIAGLGSDIQTTDAQAQTNKGDIGDLQGDLSRLSAAVQPDHPDLDGTLAAEIVAAKATLTIVQGTADDNAQDVTDLRRDVENLDLPSEEVIGDLLNAHTQCDGRRQDYDASTKSCIQRSLQSCEDVTVSGRYTVDLDGEGGLAPIMVDCRVDAYRKWMIIRHDQDAPIEVKGVETSRAHKTPITYQVTNAHLQAIREQASTCRQHIKYSSEGAILLRDGHSAWKDFTGAIRTNFGGSGSQTGCACGVDRTCEDSTSNLDGSQWKCHSDQNAHLVPVTDAGFLTNKAQLPVMELQYGDTGDSGERGFASLGPLECTFEPQLPQNCNGLSDGIYFIDLDGPGGRDPVEVRCEFKEGKHWTVVVGYPRSGTCTGKETQKSCATTMTASAPSSLAEAIYVIDSMQYCRQHIRYACRGSLLNLNQDISNIHASWNDRHGREMRYWGGSTRNGFCGCFFTPEGCAGGGNCNCDANDDTWRRDEGYLELKEDLPLTKISFGDTGDSSELGKWTVGNVECLPYDI